MTFRWKYHLFHYCGKNELYLGSPHSFMNALYLPQLLPSRFIHELKIEELQKQVDAMKREINNLQKTAVGMSKAIQELKKEVEASIAKIIKP